MDKRIKEEWIARNQVLQQAFRDYYPTINSKEKEDALRKIQQSLEWSPFMNYVLDHGGFPPDGISKYGIDLITERCIGDIDKIAKGEIDYDF